jgi:hypothetical protein
VLGQGVPGASGGHDRQRATFSPVKFGVASAEIGMVSTSSREHKSSNQRALVVRGRVADGDHLRALGGEQGAQVAADAVRDAARLVHEDQDIRSCEYPA